MGQFLQCGASRRGCRLGGGRSGRPGIPGRPRYASTGSPIAIQALERQREKGDVNRRCEDGRVVTPPRGDHAVAHRQPDHHPPPPRQRREQVVVIPAVTQVVQQHESQQLVTRPLERGAADQHHAAVPQSHHPTRKLAKPGMAVHDQWRKRGRSGTIDRRSDQRVKPIHRRRIRRLEMEQPQRDKIRRQVGGGEKEDQERSPP